MLIIIIIIIIIIILLDILDFVTNIVLCNHAVNNNLSSFSLCNVINIHILGPEIMQSGCLSPFKFWPQLFKRWIALSTG